MIKPIDELDYTPPGGWRWKHGIVPSNLFVPRFDEAAIERLCRSQMYRVKSNA